MSIPKNDGRCGSVDVPMGLHVKALDELDAYRQALVWWKENHG